MSGLAGLNDAPPDEAAALLGTCCAAPEWVAAMIAARPFPDGASVASAGAAALAGLDWGQIRTALDAHPRIGERLAGDGADAAWSAREQSGMRTATEETRSAIVAANHAYEERFGHVFLIFATGRTDTEMLAAARDRLGHSDEQERQVVRAELGRIVDLRLRRLVT
jgi:2-oxo-4-hydroxy-4-carboxy-5-ureidoimidazoline decarboxylase